jgi:hypothetical protein
MINSLDYVLVRRRRHEQQREEGGRTSGTQILIILSSSPPPDCTSSPRDPSNPAPALQGSCEQLSPGVMDSHLRLKTLAPPSCPTFSLSSNTLPFFLPLREQLLLLLVTRISTRHTISREMNSATQRGREVHEITHCMTHTAHCRHTTDQNFLMTNSSQKNFF